MKQDIKNGQRLKGLRKQNGYTQEYIGNLVGKDKRSISRYELGTTSMPSSVINILNKEYNLGLKSTKKSSNKVQSCKTVKQEVIAQALESIENNFQQLLASVQDLKHYIREHN